MTEKISSEYLENFIAKNKIDLAPTQSKLCLPIIQRMCQKMLKGIKFDDIKIFDDLIIDGHHRYISSLLTDVQLTSVPTQKTSATQIFDWTNIEFDENDWDTESKIQYLNEQDAKFNNIDIKVLKQITSNDK
jgi:hypothetical protein